MTGKGIFQGSPLGPRIYLYREVKYMDWVRRPVTGMPDVECRGGTMRFGAERYSDDTAVQAVE